MSFLDDAINKTKEVFDVVSQKTGEVVNVQKLRFDASAVASKRDKDFKALGRLCFTHLKDSDALTSEMRGLINDIYEKNAKLNELEAQIAKVQNRRFCPKCGAVLVENAKFCPACGEKTLFDSEDDN